MSIREKNINNKNSELNKENELLEKKLVVLQNEYESMTKENKMKAAMLAKLQKQKEERIKIIQENEEKIGDLEEKC